MIFGVYGAGGCGRGILPIVRAQLQSGDEVVFVDDSAPDKLVNNTRCLSLEEFAAFDLPHRICIAVANAAIRQRIDKRCTQMSIPYFSVQAQSMVKMDNVEIGEGALFSPFTTLTSNIRIGRHFHCNLYSYVEHDCVVGDYVTFAPAVKCNGNVKIGDYAYIGAGATLRQGTSEKPLRIGEGATIGMGAVVIENVPDGETWVGNPARPLVKR
jgi:sugar O-acyltransferase (sialic acid O-acetyltransferase NeuD family)